MKKTLSIILAILMLLSVCPVAFAAEDYEITKQPTLSEPTVVTNDEGANYQWYEVEMVEQELTPELAGVSAVKGDAAANSTYENGAWTPYVTESDDSSLGDYMALYFSFETQFGESFTFSFDATVPNSVVMQGEGLSRNLSVTGTVVGTTIKEDSYDIPFVLKAYFDSVEDISSVVASKTGYVPQKKVDGAVSANLTNAQYGKNYACLVSFSDGTSEYSHTVEYKAAITEQPTAEKPSLKTNDVNATYQWYEMTDGQVPVTDKTEGVSADISEYMSVPAGSVFVKYEDGVWKPYATYHYDVDLSAARYFLVDLKVGDTITVTLPSDYELDELSLININDKFTRSRVYDPSGTVTLEVPVAGWYILYITATYVELDECYITATKNGLALGEAVPGATGAALTTAEHGKDYACLVSFSNDTTQQSDSIVIPEEHSYTELIDSKAPTCLEDGYETKRCICGDTQTTPTLPATGHNSNGTVAHKDANCTEDGVVGGTYCDACDEGKAAAEEIIPATGHNENGTVAHKDANCTEDGVVGGTYCDVCDEGKAAAEEIIPATGHNSNGTVAHKDANCTEDGVVGGTYCDVCDEGKAAAEEIIPATGHNSNGKVDHKDATCTEDGVVGGTYCNACDNGKAEAEKAIPATGHGETEIRGKVDATETTDGYTGDTYCTVCDKKIADGNVIPKLEAPSTPDEPSDSCTDCGRVHENFIDEIICLIISFIKLVKRFFMTVA